VLRVERARVDISRWYSSEWVWVEAMELDDAGGDIGPIQVLVCCDAIPEDAAEPTSG
jgi:hypothetical protein